jgi:chemosensory pili system protein ChpE
MLGIAFCAPPGVVTAESVRRGLDRGFWAALFLQLGSLIGDATWAVIALAGVAFLVQNLWVRFGLGILGSLVLLWLAWGAFRDAWHGKLPQGTGRQSRGDFTTGALLSLGNPFAIAFWLGVGGTAVSSRVANPQMEHNAIFLLAFMLGALAWAFFLASLIAWGQKLVNAAFFRWVNLVCGVFLVYFAVQLGVQILTG